MPVVGFTFTKFHAEKKRSPEGKLKINYNLSIKEVEKKELSFGTQKHQGVRFGMELSVSYLDDKDTDVGSLLTAGDVMFVEEEAAIKDILDAWKKGKKIDKEIMKQIFNASQNRSSIQAIVLSKDIGLAPPIQLPSVQFS